MSKLTERSVEILVYCRKRDLSKDVYTAIKKAYEAGWDSISDGCTGVPDLPLRIVKNPACVMHDFLYSTQKMSRKEADQLFKQALIELGYPIIGRIYWMGARLLGGFYWKKKAKDVPKKS